MPNQPAAQKRAAPMKVVFRSAAAASPPLNTFMLNMPTIEAAYPTSPRKIGRVM